jgi:bifunctional non-homologous end joining protein LigD
MSQIKLGAYTIEVSNADRVLFPDDGITKGDLIEYYQRIASTMLPHLAERPLNMQRFPRGIVDGGFWQQEISDYFPEWIERDSVPKEEGGRVTHVVCNNAAVLVYLANQACITQHIWLSRRRQLRNPDRMVFDFDPSNDEDFSSVVSAAWALQGLLEEMDLASFVMTTGSRGLHVVVPLAGDTDFPAVRAFAQDAASELVSRYPKDLTIEQRKERRRGRVFVDTLRNSYGQTMVAPYSVRAKPGAPVATPIEWNELSDSNMHPQIYTLKNIFQRLGQMDDPWAQIHRHPVSLVNPGAVWRSWQAKLGKAGNSRPASPKLT